MILKNNPTDPKKFLGRFGPWTQENLENLKEK